MLGITFTIFIIITIFNYSVIMSYYISACFAQVHNLTIIYPAFQVKICALASKLYPLRIYLQ
jgi:predicted Kef-type K+ transport protein